MSTQKNSFTISKRSGNWSDEENKMLIKIWRKFHPELVKLKRNRETYQKMAEEFTRLGFNRSWLEVRTKVKNLTTDFRKEKAKLNAGGSSTWRYFQLIDNIYNSLSCDDDSLINEILTEELKDTKPETSELYQSTMSVTAVSEGMDCDSFDSPSSNKSKDKLMETLINEIKLMREETARTDAELIEAIRQQNVLLERLINKND